ncbi:hypothetical protein CEUSTIGMA_g200.t1 [Chlamydomonas eustigma]|uniref:Uncharacterized protein n=1 Tax=Chlamydomonas eustigma TaxID=1157962 RepID=A0A250WPH1_9CHLO|nr:hypothetical protein CEUSTIGMA_g200.t1 [Chlamydomonas eustigma]|eukprot:GAX72744.1 hypothetical protein CEUSTIGMA_g200.t1 [Chlamydomonas eustigma]
MLAEEEIDVQAYLKLSNQEIEDRIDEATAVIAVIHDLQPLAHKLDPSELTKKNKFNACAEIWRGIKRVPPWERHRIVQDLEPGAIRGMWKASLARYIMDDESSLELADGYSIWEDLPEQPGQIYTFQGKCEKYDVSSSKIRFFTEEEKVGTAGSSWLRPDLPSSSSKVSIPAEELKVKMFVHKESGEVMGRVIRPWWGPFERWWEPTYFRLKLELILTPLKEDAGADMTFEYPYPDSPDFNGWYDTETELFKEDLPNPAWPAPLPAEIAGSGSPLSGMPRDFIRVAGPGVLVGCAYCMLVQGQEVPNEEDSVYFVLVRKSSKQEYLQRLLEEDIGEEEDS